MTVGHEKSEFELLLEPNVHPAAKSYQKAIYKDGIPSTMFFVDDLNLEFERLTSLGVNLKSEPTEMGGVKIAVFDDTCGNLISLCQQWGCPQGHRQDVWPCLDTNTMSGKMNLNYFTET